MQYKISELASCIDGDKCTSSGGRNFAKETWREGYATIKQIEFFNKLPKKADAPIQKIDISTLSKNEPVSEIKNQSMSETKTDEPMITVPVKWLEKVICQR
jgi:hypothetical protein